ncbi:MAG: sulfotransferase [Nocardioidaceae bacterium]
MPRYVFVVTYGRSGSTLTQGLLNTMPGALVRGENDFYILHLYRAWAGVRRFRRQYAAGAAKQGAKSAFYGLDEIKPDDFVDSARELVLKELHGSSERSDLELLGFKEVLWHRIRPKETGSFFEFFERIFPDALYVLHRRDLGQVSTSGFWRRQDPSEVDRSLHRVEEIQEYLQETRPERTVETQYERYISSDPDVVEKELRTLAEFVTGECDDTLLANLKQTMTVGHGPNPFGKSRNRPVRQARNKGGKGRKSAQGGKRGLRSKVVARLPQSLRSGLVRIRSGVRRWVPRQKTK